MYVYLVKKGCQIREHLESQGNFRGKKGKEKNFKKRIHSNLEQNEKVNKISRAGEQIK